MRSKSKVRQQRALRAAFVVAAALLFASTGMAFLNSSGVIAAIITPTPAVSVPGAPPGAALNVSPISQTISVQTLAAEETPGLELYRIDIGPTSLSGHLRVNFDWINPQDASGVLDNPHAFILVQLYDKAGTPTSGQTCPGGQVFADDPQYGSICLAPDNGSGTIGLVTRKVADVILHASQANESAVYVVGTIDKPKGAAPPGQQSGLTGLLFYVDAHLTTN